MRNRKLLTLICAAVTAAAMTIPAYAGYGTWQQDDFGYWWQREDGTFPVGEWKWIDGNADGYAECYHFNSLGYMDHDMTIGSFQINHDGAWYDSNGVIRSEYADEIGGTNVNQYGTRIPPEAYGTYYLNTELISSSISIYKTVSGEDYLYYKCEGIHEDGSSAVANMIFTIQRLNDNTFGGTEHTAYSDDIISFEWTEGNNELRNVTLRGYPIGNFCREYD